MIKTLNNMVYGANEYIVASRLAIQSLNNDQSTQVQLSSIDAASDPNFILNSYKITVPNNVSVAMLFGNCKFVVNGTGNRMLEIYKNTSTLIAKNISVTNTVNSWFVTIGGMAVVTPGDTLQLNAYQTSGVALNISEITFSAIFL